VDRSIPGRAHRVSRRVEPRLTAILQLRSLPQPWRDALRGGSRMGPGAVLVEPRSKAPPRQASRRRRFRPQDGLTTRPLTSSCALGGSSDPGNACATPWKYRIPIASGRWPGPGAVSSKTAARTAPGRLPSPSAPSPEHARLACACGAARVRVGSVGARHRYRCSRAGGFRHRDPASSAFLRARLARLRGEPAS
jgi:hypothetical protein